MVVTVLYWAQNCQAHRRVILPRAGIKLYVRPIFRGTFCVFVV
jgi:hypothetical protein